MRTNAIRRWGVFALLVSAFVASACGTEVAEPLPPAPATTLTGLDQLDHRADEVLVLADAPVLTALLARHELVVRRCSPYSGVCAANFDAKRGIGSVLAELRADSDVRWALPSFVATAAGDDDDDDGDDDDDDDDGDDGDDDDDDAGDDDDDDDGDDDDGDDDDDGHHCGNGHRRHGNGHGYGHDHHGDCDDEDGLAVALRSLQWNLPAMGVLDLEIAGEPSIEGTVLAIVDSGLAPAAVFGGAENVPAPLAGTEILAGWDFVEDDADPQDEHGHGTHLASVSTHSTPATALLGVTPDLSLLPVRVLDANAEGTEIDIADGIMFATDAGADVINLSLAFPPGFFPSRVLMDAIAYADGAGVIVVAAAGNGGFDQVTYPAAFRNVIAVGASEIAADCIGCDTWEGVIGSDGLTRASYSNTGGAVDVLGPSGNLTEDRNGDGIPEGIIGTAIDDETGELAYVMMAGTSHASVQVAALVARILANIPGIPSEKMRALLGGTAYRNAGTFDPDTGFGFVDGEAALISAGTTPSLPEVPVFHAGVDVKLVPGAGGTKLAVATVEVLDGNFGKTGGVTIHATWLGAVSGKVSGVTDSDGFYTFTSSALVTDGCAAGLQVDLVVDERGPEAKVSRPRGFTGITLESLGLVSANAALIGSSPLIIFLNDPSDPEVIDGLSLTSFSPDLSTSPIGVIVDKACAAVELPNLEANAVEATGALIGSSPLLIDPSGFPVTITVPAPAMPGVDVRIVTFDPKYTGNPVKVNNDSSTIGADTKVAIQDALDEWWDHHKGGEPPPAPIPTGALTPAEHAAIGEIVDNYVAFVAGDQDDAVDELDSVVAATAVALPSGATATSAHIGMMELVLP